MPKRRRRAAPKRRKRRPLLRLGMGLLFVVAVFCAAAGATFWLAESTQLLSTERLAGDDTERIRPEERRALEDILDQRVPEKP